MRDNTYLMRMYLRAYAQALRGVPSKSEDELRESASFRITLIITAPLLSLSVIGMALVHHLYPEFVSPQSPVTKVLFIAGTIVMSYVVQSVVGRKFIGLKIPKDIASVYGTPAQIRLRFLELFFWRNVHALGWLANWCYLRQIIARR
jgi:hypothetical protein